jgi:hypothetical protein
MRTSQRLAGLSVVMAELTEERMSAMVFLSFAVIYSLVAS